MKQPLAGRTLAGCRLIEPIGAGAMGVVYRGIQENLDREVAVKALAPHLARDDRFRARFRDEARLLARLAHPNIGRIFFMSEEAGECLLVLELIDGESLGDRLERQERLPAIEVARIALQSARALDFAALHGVIHRDVKPGNLMITPAGSVKVVDFGVAHTVDAITGQATAQTSGSAHYMSPEQARGHAVDSRSDIYSLGITLWHALTGRFPFDGPSPMSIAIQHQSSPLPQAPADMPETLLKLIGQMTRKDPAERPGSFAEVVTGLEAWLDQLETPPWALILQPDPERGRRCVDSARRQGLEPVLAHAGDDALSALNTRGAPAVLVSELSVPRVDGFSVIRGVRRLDPPVPVVVMSAFEELKTTAREQAEKLGVVAVADAAASPAWLDRALVAALRGEKMPSLPTMKTGRVHARDRLERIEQLELVDEAAPPPALQAIVERVAADMNVPVALVSLVLDDRQWFKAHTGLGGALLADRGTPLADAFCRHVVDSGTPLVVNDAAEHPFFARNRLVQEGAVGSYAGAPITTADGHTLGTLCAIDGGPHSFGQHDVAALTVLARRVSGELALQAASQQVLAAELPDWLQDQSGLDLGELERSATAALVYNLDGDLLHANPAACELFGAPASVLEGLDRDRCMELLTVTRDFGDRARAELRVSTGAPYAGRHTLAVRGGALTWSARPLLLPEGPVQIEFFENFVR